MANERGSYYTTPERTMRAFDKLPIEVRQRLTVTDRNHATQPLLTKLRRGWSPEFLITLIEIWDRKDRDKHRRRLLKEAA